MNTFSIKDIENLTGIKAHTWRMWEHRYGIEPSPYRKNNQRIYNNESLKQVLRISHLYHSGIKISSIAAYNTEELKKKSLEIITSENKYTAHIHGLIEAAIDLDDDRFSNLVSAAFSTAGVRQAMLHIIYPFQERIGRLWLTDHVVPAQEHFTSNIIRQKLAHAIDNLPGPQQPAKTIVLFTPQDEYHEIALQFIHYLLKQNNIKVIYFGCSTSLHMLASFSEAAHYDTLYFHLITQLKTNAAAYVDTLANQFPAKRIVMSGPLTTSVTNPPAHVQLLQSIDEMTAFCCNG